VSEIYDLFVPCINLLTYLRTAATTTITATVVTINAESYCLAN